MTDKVLERLGMAVKDARSHANMTQKELAGILSISRCHLVGIEKVHKKPSYDLLCLLIQKLDLPAQMIIHPKVTHYPSNVEKLAASLRCCNNSELTACHEVMHMVLSDKQRHIATTFADMEKQYARY